MKAIQKIIVWYFLLGAICAFCVYLFLQPQGNFVLYLIPNLIALCVFICYIIICYLYLKNFGENTFRSIFLVMILVQSLQFYIYGYTFANYYLPEAALLLNLNSSETIVFSGDWFKLKIVNGYFKDNDKLAIGINSIGIILMIISSLKIYESSVDATAE